MADLQRALLFINLHKVNAQILAEEIGKSLKRKQIETFSCDFTRSLDFYAQGPFDIAFSLGGDGTVLYAARSMAPLGVPILPVNLGTLGFIASVPPDEWALAFNYWIEGSIGISRRLMLEITVERDGRTAANHYCLNDAVISASGIAKIIRLHVESENMRLGKYRSDGLIVATPTGSTAYSVSAGGPILDPEMEAFIINPICPFTLSNRPIVVPVQEVLEVEVEPEQRSGVLLTLDGQVTEPLEPRDRVYIKRAPFDARLIASDRNVFYRALRTKLSWSGGPDA
ncbi:MAG: NAD(+)/NADH kinase [Spirochaetaceae bacterium]|jgi:NAD+ kinase|nr:NAD(+)/NADH kinase [Spirochaetaceae bacterium]